MVSEGIPLAVSFTHESLFTKKWGGGEMFVLQLNITLHYLQISRERRMGVCDANGR